MKKILFALLVLLWSGASHAASYQNPNFGSITLHGGAAPLTINSAPSIISALGGQTINANSVFLKPQVDLELCIGDSNAGGRGTFDALIDGVQDPMVWQWDGLGSSSDDNSWIIASALLYQTEGVETTVGPCYQAAIFRQQQLNNTGISEGIIPLAVGSTGIVIGQQWQEGTCPISSPNPGYLYCNAITQTNAAIAAASTRWQAANIDYAIMALGGADGFNVAGSITTAGATEAAFETAEDAMFAGLRTNITGATNMPILVNSEVPAYIQGGQDGQVDLAEKDTPRRDNYTAAADRGDGLVAGAPLATALACNTGTSCATYGYAHWSAIGQRLNAWFDSQALAYAQANCCVGGSPALPGAPTNLIAEASGVAGTTYGGAVHLQWTQPLSRFTAASVQYRVHGTSSWTTYAITQGTTNDIGVPYGDVDVYGLALNTLYDFQVAMVNESGTGPYSAILTISTAASHSVPFDPVMATTESNATSDGATFTALAPLDGDTLTGYSFHYRPDGVLSSAFTTVTGITSLPFTLTTAPFPGTLYDGQLAPVNSAGTGPYGGPFVQFTTTGTQSPPNAPSGVAATAPVGGTTLAVTFVGAAAGFPTYSYYIYACTNTGMTAGCVGTNTGSTALSGTISGLVPATLYYIEVAGVNNGGQGAYSTQISQTTGTSGAPAAPTGVTATPGSTGNAEALAWSAAGSGSTPTYYVMQACLHGTSTCVTQNTSSAATSGIMLQLTPATPYDFSVAAANSSGVGSYSTSVEATTGSFDFIMSDIGSGGESSCSVGRAVGSGENGETQLVAVNSADTAFNIPITNNLVNTIDEVSDAAGGNLYLEQCNDLATGRAVVFDAGANNSIGPIANMPVLVSNGSLVTLSTGVPAMEFPCISTAGTTPCTSSSGPFSNSAFLASTTAVAALPGANNWEIALLGEEDANTGNSPNSPLLGSYDSVSAFGVSFINGNEGTFYGAGSNSSPGPTAGAFTVGQPFSYRAEYFASSKTVDTFINGTQSIVNGVLSSPITAQSLQIGGWFRYQSGTSPVTTSAPSPGLKVSEFVVAVGSTLPVTLSSTDIMYASQHNYGGTQ